MPPKHFVRQFRSGTRWPFSGRGEQLGYIHTFYSIHFLKFIHSTNVYWALLMPTLGLNAFFVFDEQSKYPEMSNIGSLSLRSSEPNEDVPKLS